MSEYICKIEALANGFEVELYDPEIAKANEKGKGRYRDPMVGHGFKTVEEVVAFLKANLKAAGPDEYTSSFKQLSEEEDDDE